MANLFNKFKSKICSKPENSSNLWSGNYSIWTEALKNSTGYTNDEILDACLKSMLRVKSGEFPYERDSVLFEETQYSFGLLSGLLKSMLENNGLLSVLDFGGSLGSSYFQTKNFIKSTKIEWSIIEQEKFVRAGKLHFENKELKFYHSIEECLESRNPRVILLSSVLQYLEKPEILVNSINSIKSEYIIIDRTAFVTSGKNLLTVQTVPSHIYKGSYPSWFFNKDELYNLFTNYIVLTEFNDNFTNPITINENRNVYWAGCIMKKI